MGHRAMRRSVSRSTAEAVKKGVGYACALWFWLAARVAGRDGRWKSDRGLRGIRQWAVRAIRASGGHSSARAGLRIGPRRPALWRPRRFPREVLAIVFFM